MYRIEIPAKLWAACGAAVSTKDSRPILNGVQIVRHDTHAVACATNGHALVAGRWALENDGTRDLEVPDSEVIVPFVKLSALGVAAKATDTAFVVLTSSDDRTPGAAVTWHVSALVKARYSNAMETTGRSVTVREIEGPFPNWRQVVPQGDPTPVATFALNPEVLAQACDVLGPCTVAMYDAEKALVVRPTASDLGFQAFGLVYPMRIAGAACGVPSWVR